MSIKWIAMNYTHGFGPLARCLDVLFEILLLERNSNTLYKIILPENHLSDTKLSILNEFYTKINSNGIKLKAFKCRELGSILDEIRINNSNNFIDYIQGVSMKIDFIQSKLLSIFNKDL